MDVLIIEDDPLVADLVARTLEREGHATATAADGRLGLREYEARSPDACILDLGLPEIDGRQVLARIRERDDATPVIVLTGDASVDAAVESMRRGADDFLTKPFEPVELLKAVELARERRQSAREIVTLREELRAATEAPGHFVVGESRVMRELAERARTAAATSATVLITGDSGTGKSLLAERIHRSSDRADGPFVPVSCAALPADLVESELFGHARGAFTGASAAKPGRFELARGGTIFLDEIGELPLSLQPKLLRVLQSGEYQVLGSTESRSSDARVLAATNRELEAAVRQGEFREDLYFRLDVIRLRMPALRERVDDIPALVDHFAGLHARVHGKDVAGVSAAAIDELQSADWPGNVRQLANAVERAVVFSTGGTLEPDDFRLDDGHSTPGRDRDDGRIGVEVGTPLDEVERRVIEATLENCGGNRERAASLLGVSVSTLYRRLREYGATAA